MIKTIKELQKFILQDIDDYDDLVSKERRMMTSPGCSIEEIKELKRALPGIPDSYTKWIEAVNFNGIDIGYFGASPFSYNPGGMVANLIEGNEDGVMFWEYMRQYHLYSIATIDGSGIFVATSFSPFQEGEIITIDESIYADKDNQLQWIFRLAKDFEQFLLVAGNINQIRRTIKDDNKRKQELINILKVLGVSEEYQQTWLSLF